MAKELQTVANYGISPPWWSVEKQPQLSVVSRDVPPYINGQ